MGVYRRSVHHLIAYAAGPGGVPAAVAETGLMSHQDLVRPRALGAMRGRVGDPISGRFSYELAQHNYKPMTATEDCLQI